MYRDQRGEEPGCGEVLCCTASHQLCPAPGADRPEASSSQLAEGEPSAGKCWNHRAGIQQQEQALFQVQHSALMGEKCQ